MKVFALLLVTCLISACAPPLAPAPVADVVVAPPAATIALTVSGATSVHESLLNVTVYDATGKGVLGAAITMTTTAGTLNHPTVNTSSTGTAQILLTTTDDATVTARLGELVASVRAIAYHAPEPPPPSVFVPPPPPPPATCANTPSLCPAPPPPAPTLTAALTCTPIAHGSPTPCNVTASYGGTPLPGTVVTNVNWDWADGTALQSTATPINAHSYVQAGTYTVYVLVTANTPDGVRDATATKVLLIP